mgnify:CR=1 FL=1
MTNERGLRMIEGRRIFKRLVGHRADEIPLIHAPRTNVSRKRSLIHRGDSDQKDSIRLAFLRWLFLRSARLSFTGKANHERMKLNGGKLGPDAMAR